MNKKSNNILSIIVPVYNEIEVIQQFHQRITAVMQEINYPYEIIYIDDGSEDETLAQLNQLKQLDNHISIVDLSRNFGKEIAMSAGLDHSIGDAVIIIDADLQDPPELIPQFIQEWHNGYDVVYAQRNKRQGESWLKKKSAENFYKLLGKLSEIEIPKNTGDFRLLSRRAVDALKTLNEHHRYMKGLFAWIGYPQKAIFYDRDPRASGQTKWSYWRLWNFAIEGITSFSNIPLRISAYLGFITACGAFLYGTYMLLRTLIFGNPIAIPLHTSIESIKNQ